MRIPGSTYRVQFNRDFRFADALRIVDYLHDLGITDLYASPIMKARPGSIHGYDVTDPTQLNPELGPVEDFEKLCGALREKGMGLLLDIVPNHMAATPDNHWWFDVLEKGEESAYADFFDVNWESKQILLPILGRPYGEALDKQELEIRMENGRPILQYHEQRLPLAAGAENLNFDTVDEILSRQHYRLAYWRKASDSINYRRFFDISDLVSLRSEKEEVFEATHRLPLKLVAEGNVTGLRVDHIDGLVDPKGYLDRLPQTYVIVEKILGGREHVPCDWKTNGTTGYDFLNFLNSVFIDREGFHKLEKTWSDFTGLQARPIQVFRQRKRQVMKELFAGEVEVLLRQLCELAEEDRHARDLGREDLKEAFAAVTACLPVYRTYIRDMNISETDRAQIEDAVTVAGKGPAFEFLRRILLLSPAWYLENSKTRYLAFVMRWQQFTGPVMAKGLEDTTFYVRNPLLSVNEVGGDAAGPESSFGVEEFHRRNQIRRSHWPAAMNASSTHDTKRSEDVRARINILSEMPGEWEKALHRWARMNPSETAPDANEQVLIYQSMLGAWPIDPQRLKQFVTKALREGKTHTNWLDVNTKYEKRVLSFVDRLYARKAFLKDFTRLQGKLAYFGGLSSLSQLVLKITSPGAPDFYRGTELWDLSLADPDNRRPVDFTSRIEMLRGLKQEDVRPAELLKNWHSGRIKIFTTWKALEFRRAHIDLFREGEYIPLRVTGALENHIIAFARRLHGQWCVVAVPRLISALTRAGSPPLGKKVWKDTRIELPQDAPLTWTNIFTTELVESSLLAARIFATLPIGILTSGF
jgi:(1->4)-alpha-D-glucan 1-alpha-D-glucosylmutase